MEARKLRCTVTSTRTGVLYIVRAPNPSPVLTYSRHICASILGNEWSPVLSVVAVCVTLQSMLASSKVRPHLLQSSSSVSLSHSAKRKVRALTHRLIACQSCPLDLPTTIDTCERLLQIPRRFVCPPLTRLCCAIANTMLQTQFVYHGKCSA